MFFKNEDKTKKIKKIESFEILTLRLSGMRYVRELELVSRGEETQLSSYMIRFEKEGNVRVPIGSATLPTSDVINLLNRCGVGKWSGFYGSHPRRILDGTMFNLEAVVNRGEKIKAAGSQNFPPHFSEFREQIEEIIPG